MKSVGEMRRFTKGSIKPATGSLEKAALTCDRGLVTEGGEGGG